VFHEPASELFRWFAEGSVFSDLLVSSETWGPTRCPDRTDAGRPLEQFGVVLGGFPGWGQGRGQVEGGGFLSEG